ncbi:hypothetical protein [Planctomicrobium sp. SH664]|uniref:hypothetical protein n=1 Tax=Planctomicrobium sp. SH664 TaxID=3448125 RepID=UPI003F5C4E45
MLALLAASLPAQEKPGADRTSLEIELLMPQIGSDPLIAHRWRQEFEKAGEGVRIRQPIGSDRPMITEVVRGTLRTVRIIGRIERSGILTFPSRTFTPDQGPQLAGWLQELKTYGAQGSPAGQARWGLNDAQLKDLLQSLAQPVTHKLQGKSLAEGIELIPLPPQTQVTFHTSSEPSRQLLRQTRLHEELQGLSAGTALAYLLSQGELVFRPVRQPDGSVQLVIQPQKDIKDAWPIGYDPPVAQPRNEIVPSFFKMQSIGIESRPLGDVLNACEERTGVHILIDLADCLAHQLDPEQIVVSYRQRRTAYAVVVESVCHGQHLKVSYKLDEAGTPFLWVIPFPTYNGSRSTQPKPSQPKSPDNPTLRLDR